MIASHIEVVLSFINRQRNQTSMLSHNIDHSEQYCNHKSLFCFQWGLVQSLHPIIWTKVRVMHSTFTHILYKADLLSLLQVGIAVKIYCNYFSNSRISHYIAPSYGRPKQGYLAHCILGRGWHGIVILYNPMPLSFRSSWSQASSGLYFQSTRTAKSTNSSFFFPEHGIPRCVKNFFNSSTPMAQNLPWSLSSTIF